MITIYYPNSFDREREYIIRIIFKDFLGLEYRVFKYEGQHYKIVLENNSLIFIKDSFFIYQKDDDYLKIENIPLNVQYTANPFILESNIPIIYGNKQMEISEDKIICGIDIFASSFFMLTRWEEYVNKERDLHNRFPATASLAFKHGFLNRPIVNEYVEMLWNMLTYLGIRQKRKEREFKFLVTHDVDSIRYWKNTRNLFRVLGGDFLKRKSFLLFKEHLMEYSKVKFGKMKDPHDTFDYLMDLSESANIKSRFYFMSGGLTKFDNQYHINESTSLKIIKRIKERGHIIGFHPSYNAYNNPEQWKKEKDILEEIVGFSVKEGRQHYLRFDAALTWNIWNQNRMEMDCTLSYADREGFRCGTCYEYQVFDFINRKKLYLKEYPLLAMEASFTTYQKASPKEMEEKINALIQKVRKYKGNFVFLWHNSSFNSKTWIEYTPIYEKVLRNI